MQGILLVDKPIGWTSFDVVNYVRRIIAVEQNVKPKQIKVGHIGTLDPMASGLLVLLIGKQYTKLAPMLSKLDKQYIVEMKLGEVSETGDRESQPIFYSDYRPSKEELKSTVKTIVGSSSQVPPIYSAVKINGRRAYELARKGKPIVLEARPIKVYSIELTDYNYPLVNFTTKVSSGTYIRSLVSDIGQQLTTGAYMSKLSRLQIGPYRLENAIELKGLTYQTITANIVSK